jgi:peptidoglycan/LPS O-acetylase OafA/YrhL
VQVRSRFAALGPLCLTTVLSGATFAAARVLQQYPLSLLDGRASFSWLSYSLYVLHFPFVLFSRAWLVPVERWYPTSAHHLCAASIGAGSLLFAWLVSLVTEAKTDVARAKLNRLFGLRLFRSG